MDTNKLIFWSMGVVLIAIGLPLFYLGGYLSAPEDQKKRKAQGLRMIAVVWMAAGVLIYLGVLTSGLLFKP